MTTAKIVQHASSNGSARTVIRTRNFEIVMDEPKSVGGGNDAPSPCEYMLASLAGCLNAVARGVARENGWTVGAISFDLEGELEIESQGIAGEERAVFRSIQVRMHADDTSLSPEERQRWLRESERRCAVSRSFANPVRVEIRMD